MAKKLRVGVLFGGRSGEHEVSLKSAASILKVMDRKKYDVVRSALQRRAVAGRRQGAVAAGRDLCRTGAARRAGRQAHAAAVADTLSGEVADEMSGLDTGKLDVVFPVLHGTFGEDGTIQGMLELADVAYVGSGVLGSAVGMDKAAMKTMFAAAGLPQVKYVTVLRGEWAASPRKVTSRVEAALRYPLFVKPANLGSSVGISKVRARGELKAAMEEAAQFDRKIVVEEGVGGRAVWPARRGSWRLRCWATTPQRRVWWARLCRTENFTTMRRSMTRRARARRRFRRS